MVLVSTGEQLSRVFFLASMRAVANFFGEQRDMSNQAFYIKIRASEHLQKCCEREQASTNVIFASNSSTWK